MRYWVLLLPGWDGKVVAVNKGSLLAMREAAAGYPGAGRVVSTTWCKKNGVALP